MSNRFPLFDPLRLSPGGEHLLSVSELTSRIRGVIEADFGDVGVQGEISNLARPRSGHIYFCLKDNLAQIKAVIWRSAAQRVVFDLQDGQAVRVWGGVTVYEPRGEYQIVVRKIEPAGMGALELAFRQTVARLEAEGLFAAERKRPIPRFPARIAVVTSPTGAAVRDIIRVIGGRWPVAELVVVPARVQGEGAAQELADALDRADTLSHVDFIILARGGGSLEDLWAFNEEVLARAIVRSRLPVVSAVGHEVDVTVADLAADLRAPTPSAAGSHCTPDIAEVRHRLEMLSGRVGRVIRTITSHARHQLDSLAQRGRHALQRRLATQRQRIDLLSQRLDHAMRRDLDRRHRALAQHSAKLEALSPLGVLERGYSITLLDDSNRILRDATDVKPDQRVRTRLARGTIVSRVESDS